MTASFSEDMMSISCRYRAVCCREIVAENDIFRSYNKKRKRKRKVKENSLIRCCWVACRSTLVVNVCGLYDVVAYGV